MRDDKLQKDDIRQSIVGGGGGFRSLHFRSPIERKATNAFAHVELCASASSRSVRFSPKALNDSSGRLLSNGILLFGSIYDEMKCSPCMFHLQRGPEAFSAPILLLEPNFDPFSNASASPSHDSADSVRPRKTRQTVNSECFHF
ncbi:hypothetical protein CEXT_86621 [Caerostris extrusa]|uniref:Uncharacterized protein n=1 Tax=Caerostris extrusa TaxID=172846 RepID=A0AAV4N976_CAEEX|nr:hypothetical protein CEXT_86621 [Caerostris extrusa]